MGRSSSARQLSEGSLTRSYPFDWRYAIAYLGRSNDEILDVVEGQAVRRAVGGPAGPALIEIQPNSHDGLDVRVLAGDFPRADAIEQARRQYHVALPRDAGSIEEPLARKMLETFGNAPIVQAGSPYEALVWAILGQQITVQFAYRLKRALVECFGEPVTYDGRTYFAFPRAERLAELDHERDLRPLQFSRQKSRYIIEISRALVSGELDFDEIATLDDDQASARLQEHIGVGRWTAEYVLLRGLGRLDALPAGDAGLKAAVGVHLDLGRNATEDEVREIAEPWQPYRGAIGFLIWVSLQYGWFHKAPRLGG